MAAGLQKEEEFNWQTSYSTFNISSNMARYRGPKSKIARKFGEPIYGPDKVLEKKNYPPGMHGSMKKKKKISEYGGQLEAKQKAKYTYGILERQFSNIFTNASRKKGVTGTTLLQLLEARVDNVVYRLGISPTRRGARQLVSHQHIVVNGKVVSYPSYTVKPGDRVGVREKSKMLQAITDSVENNHRKYEWLEWDRAELTGRYLTNPEREQIPENIKEQLIVELYSK
jgi:small subunit ribosomal protein S4